VYVNGEAYYLKDEAVPLQSRYIIQISSESFFFLLPPTGMPKMVKEGVGAGVAEDEEMAQEE
jgi:hypothetical protein